MRKNAKVWTTSELDFIKKNVGLMTRKEMAACLGVTPKQVGNKIDRMNIRQLTKVWSSEETKFLIENFETMSRSDLAKHFDVSTASITNKAVRLGLIKNVEKKCSGMCERCSKSICVHTQEPVEYVRRKVWTRKDMKEILWNNHTYWERQKFKDVFRITSEELDELYDEVLHEHGMCLDC